MEEVFAYSLLGGLASSFYAIGPGLWGPWGFEGLHQHIINSALRVVRLGYRCTLPQASSYTSQFLFDQLGLFNYLFLSECLFSSVMNFFIRMIWCNVLL
jgi:hypothetical protein